MNGPKERERAALRVATYNMRRGLGMDSVLNLERTAGVIRATGAAFIALQELDRNMERSGRIDQPSLLAELTGLHVGFWPTLKRRRGEYGIGVAAVEPVEATFRRLPRAGSEEPRGAFAARFRGVGIVAAHLSTDPAARPGQIRALIDMARELDGPAVLMGDFNMPRHELGPFISAGYEPGDQHRTLISATGSQIDYILSGRGVTATSSWTLPSGASDHVPLVADLAVVDDRPR
jgi:endonuclease/exonuclease/phosphatase family metal-dependent hydrolase